MSFLSTFWYPISSQRVSSLYVEFIQSRDSELIALLLQIHGSPESSGSPLRSPFLTLLLLDCKKKKIPSVSSFLWEVVLFSVKVRLSSPDVPCFCSHLVFVSFSLCLSHSSESLRHSSVSPLSGGEQGRDPIPGTQLDWVVWEVWVVLLSPLLLTVFFFSLWFSFQLLSSCHYKLCGHRENYVFLAPSLTHLFPFTCSSSTQ